MTAQALKRTLRLGLLLVASASLAQAAPDARSAKVEALVKRLMQTHKIPGAQLAVVQDGKLVLRGAYGIANVEDAVPVTAQTVFPVHSITKAFVGVAVMQLVEEGKLDLTAPVSRYLDGLPASWGKVTIRQLLTHVSGIPDLWDKHARMIVDGEDALLSKLQSLPMEFPTGERVSYNQTNYYLLGKVITKLSGKPFTQFISDRQFRTVGMPHTGFGDSHDVVPHLAGTYCFCSQTDSQATSTDGLRTIIRDWPTYIWTAVALNTTAEDLAHWVIALQSGKLLKPGSLVTLWTPGTLNDGSVGVMNRFMAGYAIGWPLVIRAEHRAVASTGGNRAALFIYPDDDLTIILLTNLVGAGPERFMDRIAGDYLPDMRASGFGLPPDVKRLNAELRQRGFENAPTVAKQLREGDSSVKLSEDELTTWAYQLLEEGEDKASINVFKLTVAMYPASANTYDSLAEAYETTGDKQRAIQNYARSLELDPKNTNAAEHLAKLRGAPPPPPPPRY